MIVLAFIGLFAFLLKVTPAGFVPNEDQSFIMADVSLPPASSLERTTAIADQVMSIARSQPEMNSVVRVAGSGILSGGAGGSYGSLFMNLIQFGRQLRADLVWQLPPSPVTHPLI